MSINPYVFPGIKQEFIPLNLRSKIRINASMDIILQIVADNCNLTTEEILSKTRKGPVADARHIFCGIAKMEYGHKVTTLGKFLKRDHTTAIHAVKNYNNRTRYQVGYKEFVDSIIEKINNKFY